MTDLAVQSKASRVKQALSAHSAMGVAISAVLYIICLSGTLSVFKEEISLFEQGRIPVVMALSGDALMTAADAGMQAEPDSAHLFIHMPTATKPYALVQTDNTESFITSEGKISAARNQPWTDFLIDLHYYLHLPKSFGMLIVAMFGVLLFAMSVSGILAHPKIFKDAFAFRRSKSEQIKQVDLHNRLSVWTMPFHLSNSLTGAMIGLATLSALAVAAMDYNGDTSAVFGPVFGTEPPVNEAPASMARIDLAMSHVTENYGDTRPVYAILHDPNTQGQYLQIMAEHPRRLIYAEKYNFNGAGEFIGTVGSSDGEIGQQVADSVYKIHFGAFGGLPVKLAFGVFGICLLFIITSGMKIYFIKQAAKGKAVPAIHRAWQAIVWGAPGLLAVTFLMTLAGVATTALQWVFWGGLALCICVQILREKRASLSIN